jgi:hypothetical protein
MNPLSIPNVSIPIGVLLILYALFVLFYLLYTAFNIYHLARFSPAGGTSYGIIIVYGVGSFVLLAITLLALGQYDWSVPLSLSGILHAPENGSSLYRL